MPRGDPPDTAPDASREAPSAGSARRPNHVDAHVSRRLRLRRVLLGLSQDELARRLGITAQQVQKYEAGETRISASRLHAIARLLSVEISFFFEELEDREAGAPDAAQTAQAGKADLGDLMARREARELVESYFAITDERLRRKVLGMLELLRERGEE